MKSLARPGEITAVSETGDNSDNVARLKRIKKTSYTEPLTQPDTSHLSLLKAVVGTEFVSNKANQHSALTDYAFSRYQNFDGDPSLEFRSHLSHLI